MTPALLALLFALIFSANWAQAEPIACLQGSEKNRQYHDFVNQKTSPTDPRLIAHFQRDLQRVASDLASQKGNVGAFSCYRPGAQLSKQLLYMEQIAASSSPLLIEPRCSYGSLQRESSQMSYMCDKDSKGLQRITKMGFSGPNGPCMSTDVSAYVSWTINEAVACMSPPENPIDPSLIFKKINNETGFNFGIAYNGGNGIGQLTTPAIKEINLNTTYIQQVLQSKNPRCAAFKNALAKRPTSVKNKCDWVEPSEGFARNIIYSLAYYLRIRDHYLIHGEHKVMRQLRALGITNPDYANLIALSAYGRDSWNTFPGLLAAAKKNPKNYSEFLKEAKKSSAYINETENKYDEVVSAGSGTNACSKPAKSLPRYR